MHDYSEKFIKAKKCDRIDDFGKTNETRFNFDYFTRNGVTMICPDRNDANVDALMTDSLAEDVVQRSFEFRIIRCVNTSESEHCATAEEIKEYVNDFEV
jgi:hypothetical protein